MKRSELIKLMRLHQRFLRQAARARKLASKGREKAGQSYSKNGTGDEGWHQMISLDAESDALEGAAAELELVINSFKLEVKK